MTRRRNLRAEYESGHFVRINGAGLKSAWLMSRAGKFLTEKIVRVRRNSLYGALFQMREVHETDCL